MLINSFISWIGGKKALRNVIYRLFPKNYGRYIEVFGGGGWVLFGKKPDQNAMEVYNDFNSNLANLFYCVKTRTWEFLRHLGFLPINSRDEFHAIRKFIKKEEFTQEYLSEELELAQHNLSPPEFEDVLQYPVFSDTLAEAAKNTVQAALFGPTALPTGRAWIQSGFKSMGAAQTEVYKQLISTGEKAREAYSLLNQLSAAASKGDETKKDAQLALLKGSALGNIQRNIVYYGMLASDKEKEVIEGLDNMGAEKADIAGVLGQIYQASKAADKRNALIGANLADKQKQIIYKMLISDKDPEIVQTCLDDGMSMNEYLKYAADFEGSKEYAKKYTSMKAAGITGTAAAEILTGLADLQPPAGKDEVTFVQKLRVIADSALDDAGKLKAVNAALDKTTVQKMNQANGYGINVNLYTEFQETLPKYDADGNGSYKQAEVEAALDNMELSNTERAVLWQLRTGGKHNPFDSAVGANIRAEAAADKRAGKEAKKDTTSGGFVIEGGINWDGATVNGGDKSEQSVSSTGKFVVGGGLASGDSKTTSGTKGKTAQDVLFG